MCPRLAPLISLLFLAPPVAAQEVLRTIPFAEPVGSSLDLLGDVDGDGLPELVIGSSGATVGLIPGTGDLRVMPGAYLFDGVGPDVLQVQTATYNQCTPAPGLGFRVAAGHDLTGDGVPDYVASEPWNGRLRLFDGASGADLTANASPGQFVQMGCTSLLGTSLALLPDVNGDGYADVLAGAPTSATPDNTAVYARARVYSGEWVWNTFLGNPPVGPKRLHDLPGVNPNDRCGTSVCGLGDLDGDGLTDLAVGATELWTGTGGYVMVVSGGTGALLATVGPPSGAGNLKTGETLAAGDLDGDGLQDLVVTSPGWKAGASDPVRGRVRVVSGASLAAGTPVVLLDFTQDLMDYNNFGRVVEVAGDGNGDGTPDLLLAMGTFGNGFVGLFSGVDGSPLWVEWAAPGELLGAAARPFEFGGEPYLVLSRIRDAAGVLELRRLFDAPGWIPCDGSVCPCGNPGSPGGCTNATGADALLAATGGSASLALDDLRLTTLGLPPNEGCVTLVGDVSAQGVLGNGVLCLGLPFHRATPALSSAAGTHEELGLLGTATGFPGLGLQPGTTLLFQTWYRDPGGPCGGSSNLSNAYALSVTP